MRDRAQRHPTRGLTEGAILAALTVIVAAVGLITPLVGVLLAPLPILLLVIRWGLRIAVLASVVTGVLLLQFFGPLAAAAVIATFAPLGLGLGWGVRRGLAAQLTILVGAAASFCATIVAFAVFTAALHQDLVAQLIAIQVQAAQTVAAMQERLGVPPQKIEEMRGQWVSYCSEHQCFTAVGPSITRAVLPLALALSALIGAYLCYTVARTILRRVGHNLPGVPPLLTWRLNPLLASVLVWSAAGLSLLRLLFPPVAGLALNAIIAALFVLAFQGALVGITWLNRRGISRFAQILAGILLFQVAEISLEALAILGLLDTWFDYRRLERTPAPISHIDQPPPGRATGSQARATPPPEPSGKVRNRAEVVRPR
jgi:uncharacterized protein YybS (DUF2232 family)